MCSDILNAREAGAKCSADESSAQVRGERGKGEASFE